MLIPTEDRTNSEFDLGEGFFFSSRFTTKKNNKGHTCSVGECRSKFRYNDHNVGILWAARRKKGVRDLTRRSGESS
jgi:hypothetical protein